jgi:glycosyltransferase involved in cell wall biosynthesis
MNTNLARKVLAVYDDAPVFGGHEQMSCRGIEALAREPDLELLCLVSAINEKLIRKLDKIRAQHGNVQVIELDFSSQRFQGVRSRFERGRIREVAALLTKAGAHALLVLQGDIELSSIGVLAGNYVGIPTVSYIPVPHTLETMQAKLGRFRDPFNQWLFARPDAFITISDGMKGLLRDRGARQPIDVVLNGSVASETEGRDREVSRRKLELPADDRLVAMIGRVEYKQKRQDFLLHSFCEWPQHFDRSQLLFVGSGPDADDLKRQAEFLGLKSKVNFLDWTDGLSDVYAAIDLLVLPSRFEGVPLVMSEAMNAGVPIVGCSLDGMKEFLPPEWLFPPGDKEACAATIASVLNGNSDNLIASNKNKSIELFSLERFENAFVSSMRKLGRLSP